MSFDARIDGKRKRFDSQTRSIGKNLNDVTSAQLPYLRVVCGYAKDHQLVQHGMIHSADIRTHAMACLQNMKRMHFNNHRADVMHQRCNSVLQAVDELSSTFESDFAIACPTVG